MAGLHILNGEATAIEFKKSSIEGDVAVWNEALVEGPVLPGIGSPAFWSLREKFVKAEWNFSFDYYRRKMGPNFKKIENFYDYDEIILWFEHDLFCQINLVALLSWFYNTYQPDIKLYMISLNRHPNHNDFRGFGKLRSEEFYPLLKNKKQITGEKLAFANKLWEAFCHSNPKHLIKIAEEAESREFIFFKTAIKEHILRFPSSENGLSKPEFVMLDFIGNKKPNEESVIKEMINKHNKILGFSDLQYYSQLKRLSNCYYKHNNKLELNDLGFSVLNNESNFLDYNKDLRWVGGALNRNYEIREGKLCESERKL